MSLYCFFALFLRKRQAVMNMWHYEIARKKRCSKGTLLVKTRIRIERQKSCAAKQSLLYGRCHAMRRCRYDSNARSTAFGDITRQPAHWEKQRHISKFDKMDLSILVKSPFHSAYFSKSVIAVSSKLTRERAQKS